jgi:hypothetical protein
MAARIHGRLAAVDLNGNINANVLIYQCPAGRKATVTINVCNRSGSTVSPGLAIVNGAVGALAASDYIEFALSLAAGALLERSAITLAPSQSLVCTQTPGTTWGAVNAVVWGIEEDV